MEPVFASHFQVCLVPGTYGAGASWCLAPRETTAFASHFQVWLVPGTYRAGRDLLASRRPAGGAWHLWETTAFASHFPV
jgi:hypothetical protein